MKKPFTSLALDVKRLIDLMPAGKIQEIDLPFAAQDECNLFLKTINEIAFYTNSTESGDVSLTDLANVNIALAELTQLFTELEDIRTTQPVR
ncbi:MAG: hypothetical protein ACKVJE_21950 [Pseudomonadales bacterium]